MKLQDLLQKNYIVIDIKATGKLDLISQMGRYLASCFDLGNPELIIQKIVQREADMSTGIGFGIAIPHCRLDSVSRSFMIAARAADDIDFEAIDDQPVRLAFMMVSPPNTTEHGQILSQLSKVLKDETTRDSLLKAATAEEFLSVIMAAENSLGLAAS